MTAAEDSYHFQKYIVALGIGLLLMKFAAWLLTDSVAILTDAMESIVNVVAGFTGLYALYLSAKPRDSDHPYGHGKVEYISAAIEGSMITVAGLLIIVQALGRIVNPTEVTNLDVGLILIAVAAVANFAAGSMAIRKGRRNRSQALVAAGKHLHTDTYSSIGIIAGLIIMVALGHVGHDVKWLDGVIALLFGVIIIITGAKVLKDSFDCIMDRADRVLLGEVVDCLNENRHENWTGVHNLRVVKNGWMLHIDVHMTFPCMMTVGEQYVEICAVEKAVKDRFGDAVEMSITGEPCHSLSCPGCMRECPHRRAEFTGIVVWTVDNLSEDELRADEETTSS